MIFQISQGAAIKLKQGLNSKFYDFQIRGAGFSIEPLQAWVNLRRDRTSISPLRYLDHYRLAYECLLQLAFEHSLDLLARDEISLALQAADHVAALAFA